jgi:cation:H+ antiporter
MIIFKIIYVLFGLGLLILGGNFLVKGSSVLAKIARIPEMIVGLTIVSIGTSAPELFVNIKSALIGSTELAISNVVGSNIANILLILGIGAIIIPISIERDTHTKDIPFAILGSLILWILTSDVFIDKASVNILSRVDSFILISFFLIFMRYLFSKAKNDSKDIKEESFSLKEKLVAILSVPAGIFILALGGNITVDGAISLAQVLGVSERIIGLTIVAVGTSLPELVTTVIAAMKGKTDILIGNIIGSNIFNIFFILGVTGIIKPLVLNTVPVVDYLFMTGAVVILLLSLYVGKRHHIDKWQGYTMVSIYFIYILLLIFL